MFSTRAVSAHELGLSGDRSYPLCGRLPPAPRLAVVGSRAAHRRYREQVPEAVAAAGSCGWSIVSGGALGIDGDAHRSALARNVPQLAVLPCGPDLSYPPAHTDLFVDIAARADSGLLFAKPAFTRPSRGMFASRNALVVALASAVLVMEAAVPSGTLLTVELARRRKVPVAAVRGSPGAAVAVGLGAVMLGTDALGETLTSWLQNVGADVNVIAPTWPAELGWLRTEMRAGGRRGVTIDDFVDRPGVLTALLEAEAAGLVVEVSPGRWVCSDP